MNNKQWYYLFKVGNKIELDVNFNVNELLILERRTFKYFQKQNMKDIVPVGLPLIIII